MKKKRIHFNKMNLGGATRIKNEIVVPMHVTQGNFPTAPNPDQQVSSIRKEINTIRWNQPSFAIYQEAPSIRTTVRRDNFQMHWGNTDTQAIRPGMDQSITKPIVRAYTNYYSK